VRYAPSVRRAWRLFRDGFPVRLPGLALAALGLAVAIYVGENQSDYLLYPAGIAAVGLTVLCLVVTLLASLVLRLSLRGAPAGAPDSLETTVPVHTGFRVRRLAGWPLVEIHMRWEEPEGIEVALEPHGKYLEEVITARERGRHPRVVRVFTVEDVFGLTATTFRRSWLQPLRIVTATATASGELAMTFGQGDAFSHPSGRAEGDLVEMRAYGHGDPLRYVLWKTFARTRRLLVRMPERSISPRPITVAFMVAGDGDEPTAATARLYLERGLLGPDFLFSADGATRPTAKTHEAVEQIVDSIRSRREGAVSLPALASQVEPARLGACVVFAPPVDGPWRERVTAFARRLPAPPIVVIGVEGAPPEERRGRLRRWLIRGRAPAPNGFGHLRTALENEGLRVQVLHRETGQVL